ncbi:hypothetical protein Pla108_09410 [Botrimarina colliarenosi]|uniref:Uncharacterized protein n=1 Tax=Botrimarina colliarenosi TaxID=2528001 RepID=A0A5C6AKG3_9BACT|nr:hypothetical protein [Botrimarina colliarenosi]TWT99997.1 hypothetical protein Pla108_09410 [Botrimarina colliarenosi]
MTFPILALAVAALTSELDVTVLRSERFAEAKFGLRDRIFIVQDAWELERCRRLLPDFPPIDIRTEHAVIVPSWRWRRREIESIESEGDDLVVRIKQSPRPRPGTITTTDYVPPDLFVAKAPVCGGTVRFLINDRLDHVVLRGDALAARTTDLLADLLAWKSGRRWTAEEWLARYRYEYRNKLDGEELDDALTVFRRDYTERRCRVILKELAQLQDRTVTPRLVGVAAWLGPHDAMVGHLRQTLVALGGNETVRACELLLELENEQARLVAILALSDLSIPSTRPMAHAHLADSCDAAARTAKTLLHQLGLSVEDVAPITEAIEALERQAQAKGADCRAKWALANSLVSILEALGPEAESAIPLLTRLATGPPNCFSDQIRPKANDALAAISAGLVPGSAP